MTDKQAHNNQNSVFQPRGSAAEVETARELTPKFDSDGLIPVIATDARTGDVLMHAYMNAEALARTIATGEAYYWSRSRGELWHKGATSGQIQKVIEMRTDCDQDAIWIRVEPQGDGGCCHVGYRTCFYRAVEPGTESSIPLAFKESKL